MAENNGHFLSPYFRAGYPVVAVNTVEETRLIQSILDRWPNKKVFKIACSGGLVDARTGAVEDLQAAYTGALARVADIPSSILVVQDFAAVIRNAPPIRALKTHMPALKAQGSRVVLCAPDWQLPPELAREIPVLDHRLPTREEFRAVVQTVIDGAAGLSATPEEIEACLDAMTGLTWDEGENLVSLVVANHRRLDAAAVAREKFTQIAQCGYLDAYDPVSLGQIGGMQGAKDFLIQQVRPVRNHPKLRVKGILLVGIPGCGKTLFGKAAGSILGWPTVRLDLGAVMGSLVGQSEQNMAMATRRIEAFSPCVVVLDEIEKMIAGHSGSNDSGVTSRIVGRLLVWLQDMQAPVLVIATCNDYSRLPPELTRAGRFDQRFFADLPSRLERTEIARVHLARFDCSLDWSGVIANATEGWTGAEIEDAVKAAARLSLPEDVPDATPEVTPDILARAIGEIRPISQTRASEIKAMRDWARGAMRLANTPDVRPVLAGRRVGSDD